MFQDINLQQSGCILLAVLINFAHSAILSIVPCFLLYILVCGKLNFATTKNQWELSKDWCLHFFFCRLEISLLNYEWNRMIKKKKGLLTQLLWGDNQREVGQHHCKHLIANSPWTLLGAKIKNNRKTLHAKSMDCFLNWKDHFLSFKKKDQLLLNYQSHIPPRHLCQRPGPGLIGWNFILSHQYHC